MRANFFFALTLVESEAIMTMSWHWKLTYWTHIMNDIVERLKYKNDHCFKHMKPQMDCPSLQGFLEP